MQYKLFVDINVGIDIFKVLLYNKLVPLYCLAMQQWTGLFSLLFVCM